MLPLHFIMTYMTKRDFIGEQLHQRISRIFAKHPYRFQICGTHDLEYIYLRWHLPEQVQNLTEGDYSISISV